MLLRTATARGSGRDVLRTAWDRRSITPSNALAAGPWGQGWPEPLFDGTFDVLASRTVGERHLKLELGFGGMRLNAIQFGGAKGEKPPSRARIAYRLQGDDWRGGDAVQLLVEHLEPG